MWCNYAKKIALPWHIYFFRINSHTANIMMRAMVTPMATFFSKIVDGVHQTDIIFIMSRVSRITTSPLSDSYQKN